LVYFAGRILSQLTWLDRTGKPLGALGEPREYNMFRLSPDARHIAASIIADTARDPALWLLDRERAASRRLTFNPGTNLYPVWSPDGRTIVFTSGNPWNLVRTEATGAGVQQRLTQSSNVQHPTDWSRDGRFILYEDSDPKTGLDLWILPMLGERKPVPFLRSVFNETDARFSPDGRWVAFVSDESGRSQVYVQPFQGSGEKWPISSAGGSRPRWRRDGKELYYLAADNKLMAVAVEVGHSFTASAPAVLFRLDSAWNDYDVAPDGQWILISTYGVGAGSTPITVVLNWQAGLKQ